MYPHESHVKAVARQPKPPMTDDEKELLAWLDRKFKEAGATTRSHVKAERYGEAERAVGQAEAYGWTIIHLRTAITNRAGRAAAKNTRKPRRPR